MPEATQRNDEEMIKRLRSTRADFQEELCWHRFLIDAYTGTGGFEGRVKQPATGYLGWAAEMYSTQSIAEVTGRLPTEFNSYLDRYPREDAAKHQRRIDASHYPNYVEAILDTLVSYIAKRGSILDKIPKPILEWMKNADGNGTAWEALYNDVIKPRAALLGWMPVMFDMPQGEAETAAEKEELRLLPHAIPLFPANALDWQTNKQGAFDWFKVRVDYTVRADALSEPQQEEHYWIWTPKTVKKFVIVKTQDKQSKITEESESEHGFGAVPIAIFRHRPSPEDSVRGLGMVDAPAKESRRLFNLHSELDEHLRSTVFAFLQIPYVGDSLPTEINVGTENAFPIKSGPGGCTHSIEYISPEASVATTYEVRIESTVEQIYRMARVEQDSGATKVESGVAKAYGFDKTNRKLADFATQLARAEKAAYSLLAFALKVPASEMEEATVNAPDDFNVEDLSTEIKNALDAVTVQLTPTAEKWLKRRLIGKLLPNLPKAEVEIIDGELDEQCENALSDKAEQRELDMEGKRAEVDNLKADAKAKAEPPIAA